MAIQGHKRPYKAIQGHTRPYMAMQGHTRPYKTKNNNKNNKVSFRTFEHCSRSNCSRSKNLVVSSVITFSRCQNKVLSLPMCSQKPKAPFLHQCFSVIKMLPITDFTKKFLPIHWFSSKILQKLDFQGVRIRSYLCQCVRKSRRRLFWHAPRLHFHLGTAFSHPFTYHSSADEAKLQKNLCFELNSNTQKNFTFLRNVALECIPLGPFIQPHLK